MKHPVSPTIKLLAWIVAASTFIALSLPRFASSKLEVEINAVWVAIIFVCAFAAGTVFWLKFMNKKNLPEIIFSLGIGFIVARMVSIYFVGLGLITRFFIALPVFLLYLRAIHDIRDGKVHKWYIFNNVIIITATTVAGCIAGILFPPWIAIILFALFALYDAWAVWKTKHMIVLATGLIKKGIIPGIVQPYKSKSKKGKPALALLGGGDLLFIALMASSFSVQNMLLAYCVIITMTASVCLLFLFSKDKYYPALPFLFAGMLAAFPLWWLVMLL